MASVRKIKKAGNSDLLDDLKFVNDILVYVETSRAFFKITKSDLLTQAESNRIHYYITDLIFVRKRNAIVII